MTSRPVRLLVAACLPLTALLSVASVLLQPQFTADPAERLATIDAAGTSATVSVVLFVLSQLPFLVGVVGIASLVHPIAPRTAWTGGVLGVFGGFGHAVFGGIALAYLALATDAAHRVALAEVITRVEAGPAKLFMAMGLLGTVLSLVVLGVGLFRSRIAPRWIPVALWAFVVLEFGLSGVATWASLASGLVYLAACTGLAVHLVRGSSAMAVSAGVPAPVA